MRLNMCSHVVDENTVDRNLSNNIVFSNDATLYLKGAISSHNLYYILCRNKRTPFTGEANEIRDCNRMGGWKNTVLNSF